MNTVLQRNNTRELATLDYFYDPPTLFEVWASWQPQLDSKSSIPHTDIYEEKGNLVIKTELPGIKKEDLEVTLEDDMLTVKAEKNKEITGGTKHNPGERYNGRYFRSISLAPHAYGDKVSVKFENGVLELKIPKVKEAKAKRIEAKGQVSPSGEKKRHRKSKQKAS